MKRLQIWVILIATLSLLVGCGLFGSGNSAGPGDSVDISSFPLTAGSSWTYAVYDSASQARDTVRVSILQTAGALGKKQSLWSMKYFQFADSTVVNRYGTYIVYPLVTVRIQHTDSMTVTSYSDILHFDFPQGYVGPTALGSAVFAYPLAVGKKWSDNSGNYSVVSKGRVSWNGGTFNKSYQIVQKASPYGNDEINNFWIEPGIGIVKANHNEHFYGVDGLADFSTNTTWTLLSYKLF